MTRKYRKFIQEGGGILLSGVAGAFAIPTLVSAHDTVALFAAALLALAWAVWLGHFLVRISKEK